MKRPVVHEILLQSGLVDEAGLAKAIEIQARDGGSLGRIVSELGLTSEEDAARAVARGLGLEYIHLDETGPPAAGDQQLPAAFCRQRKVLPLGAQGRSLRLAMSDPLDHATIQDVEFRTSKWIVAVVASESAIMKMLKHLFPDQPESGVPYDLMPAVAPEGELEATHEEEYEVLDPSELARDVKLPPIVRLVNLILTDAAKSGASDIHIEPQETSLQVRQRVDGMLRDVVKIPKHLQQSVVSRLKIISGMDIAERRKPQDGRSRLRVQQRKIDLRVSSLPTNFGEKIVVRLLDSANARIEMGQLAFSADHLRRFQELLSRPQGMVLVTGPTGSGKTSTLYASLNWIKSPVKNIITVEDPIEYQLEGINQVQINTKAGVTFAAGLRSILRQDPNIVLVGEIRDQETAGIALEAAQTGHLILSTLHTNDAPSSISRLIDLGVEPFMVASSLCGILAQRLTRRVCQDCARAAGPGADLLERIGGAAALPGSPLWRAGAGCDACGHSGYRGRLAIHELLVITDEIRDLITRRAPEHQLRDAGRRAGMRSLMEDGIDKAARGLTTLEEVLRVAPPDEARAGAGAASHIPQAAPSGPAPAVPSASQAAAPGPSAAGGKCRVLVVEDSPTVVTVVKYFLENEGFEVLVAEDGIAGLEVARSAIPDVVVSDLYMPGMDGIALTKALREDSRTRDAAIVILTSETSIESESKGLEIGADDYLAKPVEPKRLAARIKALLGRARARRAASA
ncbi:MAG: Flp pilus assembly complex ATPase component TadA [Acidobacteria bacterium]|nr:Flp pilus assembly complex ATPase component TadA [Acidobacteriota bacterium]